MTLSPIPPALIEMQNEVLEVNIANGWFEEGRTFGDDCALLTSEVSEALEEFREGRLGRYYELKGQPTTVNGVELFTATEYVEVLPGGSYPAGRKPIGVPSEAADILIRLLDFCHRHDIDLEAEYHAKIAFNRTRGHKHGGKTL